MQATELLLTATFSPLRASAGGAAITVDFDGSVVLQLVIFTLLFLFLKPVVLDPFVKVMKERETRTEGAKTQARQMDERAGEILERYEVELEKVRKVAAQQREQLRSEALKLEAEILGRAREKARLVTVEGKGKVHAQVDEIRKDLDNVSASIAQQAASKVLGRQVQ